MTIVNVCSYAYSVLNLRSIDICSPNLQKGSSFSVLLSSTQSIRIYIYSHMQVIDQFRSAFSILQFWWFTSKPLFQRSTIVINPPFFVPPCIIQDLPLLLCFYFSINMDLFLYSVLALIHIRFSSDCIEYNVSTQCKNKLCI